MRRRGGPPMALFATLALVSTLPQSFAQSPAIRITAAAIDEGSGLVASRRHPGILWTHNDSGDSPRVFAIRENGQLVSEVEIGGARNVDWEDLTIDDQGQLYLGDIGNNASKRDDLGVYVVREPDPTTDRRVPALRHIRFTYPDQAQPPAGRVRNFDSEALFFCDGLYLLTKHRMDKLTRLYHFPRAALADDAPTSSAVVLEPLSSYDMSPPGSPPGPDRRAMVTAADVSPDGRFLAVLTYGSVTLFQRSDERPEGHGTASIDAAPIDWLARPAVRSITLVPMIAKQAEAVAWLGEDLMISNEQRDLLRIENVVDYPWDLFPAPTESP